MSQIDAVKAWIDNVAYSHSQSKLTGKAYRHKLEEFCSFAGTTPETIMQEYEQSKDDRNFKRKYGLLLKAWISNMAQGTDADNTKAGRISAVKSFFKYSDLPLSFVPTAKADVLYHNRDVTKEEILAILNAADVRERAFFAFMVQSGLRPDTIVKLQIEDLEPLDKIPCKVDVSKQKTKGKYGAYFSFLGEDAVRYLKAYLDTRPNLKPADYVFAGIRGTKEAEKPYHRSLPSRIFQEIARTLREGGKLEYKTVKKGKPSELRLYTLRKYFRKMASQAGDDFCNFWMSHQFKVKVDRAYFSKDPEFHRKIYLEKALPYLRLESALPTENEKEISELRKEIAALKGQTMDELHEKVFLQERVEKVFDETLMPAIKYMMKEYFELAKTHPKATKETVNKVMEEFNKRMRRPPQ